MALTYGVRIVYITGITPLLLSELSNGFNVVQNLSWAKQYSELCGFTRADILESLKFLCEKEEDREKYLQTLTKYADGYHFCSSEKVERVFNTQTSILYLNVSLVPQSYQGELLTAFLVYCQRYSCGEP